MTKYIYQPDARVDFDEGVQALKNRGHAVVLGPIDITRPEVTERIRRQGEAIGLEFADLVVNRNTFQEYFEQAGYSTTYESLYDSNHHEKAFEHFVALQLLDVRRDDVFIDIASDESPLAGIFARVTRAQSFSQDIMYEDGIAGEHIGGDACALPVPDGFASKATLTCSLEHFEMDSDTRLFVELARVLRPGGAVCVVPFYLNEVHAIQTDPSMSVPAGVVFDAGASLYCVPGWGNRHGRFYSPASFKARVMDAVADSFRFTFYVLRNATAIDPRIYARFAFLARRVSGRYHAAPIG